MYKRLLIVIMLLVLTGLQQCPSDKQPLNSDAVQETIAVTDLPATEEASEAEAHEDPTTEVEDGLIYEPVSDNPQTDETFLAEPEPVPATEPQTTTHEIFEPAQETEGIPETEPEQEAEVIQPEPDPSEPQIDASAAEEILVENETVEIDAVIVFESASDNTPETDTLADEPIEEAETIAEPNIETEDEPEPIVELEPVVEETQTEPEIIITETPVEAVMYTTDSLNVRTGPGTDYPRIGTLYAGQEIYAYALSEEGWYRIAYGDGEGYASGYYITDTLPEPPAPVVSAEAFPIYYSDATSTITITKEWFGSAWCYIAHLEFFDYWRFGTDCAYGVYDGGYETTSAAAARLGAILAVNGDFNPSWHGYSCARHGIVWHDKKIYAPASYNANDGTLFWTDEGSAYGNRQLSELVANGIVTDTMVYGPAFLLDGNIRGANSGSRAQRTFIGTNGAPGDLWIVVSEGRYVDGESAGLTGYECAALLQSKGCTFGIPLDGGGSSTMVFNGQVLNCLEGGEERAVVDFLYFR